MALSFELDEKIVVAVIGWQCVWVHVCVHVCGLFFFLIFAQAGIAQPFRSQHVAKAPYKSSHGIFSVICAVQAKPLHRHCCMLALGAIYVYISPDFTRLTCLP